MQIKFNHIRIENFCAIESLDADLGDRAIVSGKNAVGKSTVKKAIQFCLNCRDENGKEISGIRPHDENGVDIDGLVTAVELTVSADVTENVLRKELFQKKNKKGEYTGENDTAYYVDGVKKSTKRAYDEFIQSLIPSEECINANVVLSKDTAGRLKLLEPFKKHTIDDVIAENPKFECIAGKLKANSTTELKASLRKKISGSKRNAGDGLEDELNHILIEIEVEQGRKHDVDVAELELARNGLRGQIAEIEAKEADISKQYEEYQKLSDGILELQFAQGDLQRKANENCNRNRREIERRIEDKEFLSKKTKDTIERTERDISVCEKKISHQTKYLKELREEYAKTSNLEFDENTLVCPYCGNELMEDEKEKRRTCFKNKKTEDLSIITSNGEHAKNSLIEEKQNLIRLNDELSEHKESLEMLNHSIEELKKELSYMPEKATDISDLEEYKSLQAQIAEKEAAMQQGNSADEIRQQLAEQKADLQSQLSEVGMQIALGEENVKIDEKISLLQKRQKEVYQQICDVERELDLLKEFEHAHAHMLEKDVNEYFEFATVKLFDMYQNGDIKDICEFYRGGTAFSKGLNHSDRMLTEVDICKAFQRLYGICCPILLDDMESLDADRIPEIENQLILFKRTDDETLKIC